MIRQYSPRALSLVLLISAVLISPVLASDPVDVGPESWAPSNSSPPPTVRICGLMVYDSDSDVVLLYGGFDGNAGSPDLWAFDANTNTWTNMTPADSPPGRFGQGWVYDETRDICLMFFGVSGTTYYNDTWEYDYDTNTWTQLFPGTSPAPRCKGGSAYDIDSDQFIFFGGFGNDTVNMAETWTYNYDENTWVNRTAGTAPSPRMRCPMIYDEKADRCIMFGGWLGGTDVLGDTWAYDFNTNTWENMNPTPAPAPRARYGRAYLPDMGKVILTHGWGGANGDYNDTWTYDHATNTWEEMDTGSGRMQPRHCFQMALDEESGVIVAQGGSGASSFHDTWLLNPYEKEEDGNGFPAGIVIIIGIIALVILIVAIVIYRSVKEE
ncbi:MAG: kelch repeat-containing protein [Thermoplasmatota archaeon]